jgi:transposase
VKNIDLRVRKGSISYDQLAKQMNINRNTVYNWFKKTPLGEVERLRVIKAIEEIEEGVKQ